MSTNSTATTRASYQLADATVKTFTDNGVPADALSSVTFGVGVGDLAGGLVAYANTLRTVPFTG